MRGDSWFDRYMSVMGKWVLEPFMAILIPGIFFVIVALIYVGITEGRGPKFELIKKDWTCTKTHIYYTWVKGVRYEHEGCKTYVKDVAE